MDEDVPPPETSVIPDEGRFRCELVVYISKGGQVKDVRLRGPLRSSRREALKDCVELRKAAVKGIQDPSLKGVREKRKELEAITWTEKDLGGRQLDGAEGPAQLPVRAPTPGSQAPSLVPQKQIVPPSPGSLPGLPEGIDIEGRCDELALKHGLDDCARTKLASVFRDRLGKGCYLAQDFEDLDTHLAASNKPSALVSMKLGELREGKPIGSCKYSGGRKDVTTFSKPVYRPAEINLAEDKELAFKPVGPNWKKPGQLTKLPQEAGTWLIHERQDQGGKYRPWLYFNGSTGHYYQEKASGDGYIGVGVPHDPQDHSLSIRAGSASLPSRAGKKLDMAVLLPELSKTGTLLKNPLEFLDKPSSLFLLCDGLRNSALATEFCARKFHTLLFPRLSARATGWEDFELVDILQEVAEAIDALLLDAPARFAGCSLAVALLVGRRLIVGTLGATRCVLCTPSSQSMPRGRASAASIPWTSRIIAGGAVHTASNSEERLRVASIGDRLLEDDSAVLGAVALHPHSAPQSSLEVVSDDQKRELLRLSRATSPFAALGLSKDDLQEGAAAVRRIFRKRSLAVHPDKVAGDMKTFAVSAFAKLEAAAKAVETMLQTDLFATKLIADVFAAHDASWIEADPAAAARLLGVAEGSSTVIAKDAIRQRFLGPFSHLQDNSQKEVAQALKILDVAEKAVVRGNQPLWTPSEPDIGVSVTRALGCADLKAPVPVLSSSFASQVVELDANLHYGMVLLADGARHLSDNHIAAQMQRHRGRPRAAALQLAIDADAAAPGAGEAVGTVCAFISPSGSSAAVSSGGGIPDPKRQKTMAGGKAPDRARVSHVLLRWAGLKDANLEERPGFPAPVRSQLDAERALLSLLDELLAGDPKTLGNRFKAAVMKQSECPSALNVPYADLGWVDRGTSEPALQALETAAFDISVGDLSDIVVTPRGAHLLYRLA